MKRNETCERCEEMPVSDIEEVALRLGMKPSEVTNMVLVADGVAAQTHDGQWTLITNDGELVFDIDDPTVEGDAGEATPKKPAPKRRSNR
jgi:hypothetical protein